MTLLITGRRGPFYPRLPDSCWRSLFGERLRKTMPPSISGGHPVKNPKTAG